MVNIGSQTYEGKSSILCHLQGWRSRKAGGVSQPGPKAENKELSCPKEIRDRICSSCTFFLMFMPSIASALYAPPCFFLKDNC